MPARRATNLFPQPASQVRECDARALHFTARAPLVHVERMLRIQGYSDVTSVRPAIQRAAEAMARLATRLSEPSATYRRVAVRGIDGGVLEVEGGFRFHCKAFDRTLKGCAEVALFVLTVGKALDDQVIELIEAGDLLEALLLETAGWLCIEDATRQFKTRLRDECRERACRITSRLGPGYSYRVGEDTCMWSLEEQATLFAAFRGAKLPVSLMASAAMQPKMSRSGLFGVAPLASAARSAACAPEPLRAIPAA